MEQINGHDKNHFFAFSCLQSYSMLLWGKYLGGKMIRTTYTVHIRSFASRSDNELFVYLLNKSDREQNIKLDLGNKKMASVSEASELAAKGPDDTEPAFRRKDLTGTEIVKMSETSITVIQCQVK